MTDGIADGLGLGSGIRRCLRLRYLGEGGKNCGYGPKTPQCQPQFICFHDNSILNNYVLIERDNHRMQKAYRQQYSTHCYTESEPAGSVHNRKRQEEASRILAYGDSSCRAMKQAYPKFPYCKRASGALIR
jgi:hypothetical protein